MTAILVGDYTPGSDDWHEARTTGIGASEISAVVGLNPWESAYSLWLRKKGLIPGPDESEAMRWGHLLEPVVAARFSDGHEEYGVGLIGTHRSAERPWQLANLDRSLAHASHGDGIPLEIKTTRYPDDWGRSGTDEIPLHVRCQVMQQMDVFGAPYGWVAALIGGSDYREYRIDFDETDAASLRDAGAAFWASLQTDDEPPIDCSIATYDAVRKVHADIDRDTELEIPAHLWGQFIATKTAIDSHDAAYRKARAEILAAMGRTHFATVNGLRVARRQASGNGTPYLKEIA